MLAAIHRALTDEGLLLAQDIRSSSPPLGAGRRLVFYNVGYDDIAPIEIATIQSVPTLSGDYNQNDTIDAADYIVWRKGLGITYTQTDYNVWRAHFGQAASGGTAAGSNAPIPEPATLVLLILANVGIRCRCRRTR